MYLLGYALVAVIALVTSAVLLLLERTTTRRRYHVSSVSSLFKQVMAVAHWSNPRGLDDSQMLTGVPVNAPHNNLACDSSSMYHRYCEFVCLLDIVQTLQCPDQLR